MSLFCYCQWPFFKFHNVFLEFDTLLSHREKELTLRWDYVFELFEKRPYLLQASSLSALIISDKQDPSLVIDISSLYKHFLEEGYHGLGMYLKSIFLLTEAFYDKTLTPQERMYRAWFCKTFLVTWDRNKKSQVTSL